MRNKNSKNKYDYKTLTFLLEMETLQSVAKT